MEASRVTASHGSGGIETKKLIDGIFAKYFSNPILNQMEDAAVVDFHGKLAMTTDSFVVDPIFFKGGDIGRLAVCGTVNDLLTAGAKPLYLTAGFILEEGLPLLELQRIVSSMADTAKEAGVTIVAGDTKVVEGRQNAAQMEDASDEDRSENAQAGGAKNDTYTNSNTQSSTKSSAGLYINTAGVGIVEKKAVRAAGVKPGDVLIVSGNLGDHHACIISSRLEIENDILSDAAPLVEIVSALKNEDIDIHTMRDITRGGLGTVLYELMEASNVKGVIEEEALPVSDAVKGLSGMLGLDPLYMGNEGKMLIAVAKEEAERALSAIKAAKYGKDAAIIGSCEEGMGAELVTKFGGRRAVFPLAGEGLPRIC